MRRIYKNAIDFGWNNRDIASLWDNIQSSRWLQKCYSTPSIKKTAILYISKMHWSRAKLWNFKRVREIHKCKFIESIDRLAGAYKFLKIYKRQNKHIFILFTLCYFFLVVIYDNRFICNRVKRQSLLEICSYKNKNIGQWWKRCEEIKDYLDAIIKQKLVFFPRRFIIIKTMFEEVEDDPILRECKGYGNNQYSTVLYIYLWRLQTIKCTTDHVDVDVCMCICLCVMLWVVTVTLLIIL